MPSSKPKGRSSRRTHLLLGLGLALCYVQISLVPNTTTDGSTAVVDAVPSPPPPPPCAAASHPGDSLASDSKTFIGYYSSPWEELWRRQISELEEGEFCRASSFKPERLRGGIRSCRRNRIRAAMAGQREQVNRFMQQMCTHTAPGPPGRSLCALDDGIHRWWWDSAAADFESRWSHWWRAVWPPEGLAEVGAIRPDDASVFSRFEFRRADGTTCSEYIEPLVGHLRHPLHAPRAAWTSPLLDPRYHLLTDRSWIVPTPAIGPAKVRTGV